MREINTSDKRFHNGNGRNEMGTVVTAEWLNAVQDELVGVIKGLGGQVDPSKPNQIWQLLAEEFGKKANIVSPDFTGTPTAPTPGQSANNQQIATTEFVKTAIAALVGSAPEALDTLAELAAALGNDNRLKEVLLAELGKKATQADFTILKNLLIGIPFPYPLTDVPEGCLAFNGQAFSTSIYPVLAQKYPSGRLPDLRGEFIRGWDNGRGVDSGRSLLSVQGDAIRNIIGGFVSTDIYGPDQYSGAFYHTNRQGVGSAINYSSLSNNFIPEWVEYDAARVVPTAAENRPRNIAFQYICLAA